MSSFLDILRTSYRTLAPLKITNRVLNGCVNNFFRTDIVSINNFASIMHYKLLIVYKLFVKEFTSHLTPN